MICAVKYSINLAWIVFTIQWEPRIRLRRILSPTDTLECDAAKSVSHIAGHDLFILMTSLTSFLYVLDILKCMPHWLNIPSKCCVVLWYTTATYVVGTLPLESRCVRYLSLGTNGTMVFCTMCRTLGINGSCRTTRRTARFYSACKPTISSFSQYMQELWLKEHDGLTAKISAKNNQIPNPCERKKCFRGGW